MCDTQLVCWFVRPFVRDTVLPYLSAVMSHLWRDFSLVMRIETIHEICGHIFGIYWALFGVTQAYHGHILGICGTSEFVFSARVDF